MKQKSGNNQQQIGHARLITSAGSAVALATLGDKLIWNRLN
jgi:hypothetical protein